MAVDSNQLKDYSGIYNLLLDINNVFYITYKNEQLYFRGNDNEPVVMFPESDSTFYLDPASSETIKFRRFMDTYRMILTNEKGEILTAQR